jgi:lipopolysaccharide export system permease protein
MYIKNELISVFSSGISLRYFILPVAVLGLGLSFGSFFFDDVVVIKTMQTKVAINNQLLKRGTSQNNADFTITNAAHDAIYRVRNYDAKTKTLYGLTLVRQKDGRFAEKVEADRAVWAKDHWTLFQVNRYFYEADGKTVRAETEASLEPAWAKEPPDSFERENRSVDELNVRELGRLLSKLEATGQTGYDKQTDFYKRFAFPWVNLIVILISCAIGGVFKKNILIMSFISSLFLAVIYYVFQMVTVLLAKLGYIPPLIGAWLPTVTFLAVSIFILRYSKT